MSAPENIDDLIQLEPALPNGHGASTDYASSADAEPDQSANGATHGPGMNGGTGTAGRKRKFKLIKFEDIQLSTEIDYRVRGVIPRVGLVCVWGPPKCGKSFWTYDVVMHVALGWDYRGHRVEQGTVVYCALEGGLGFAKRKEAFRQRHLANHMADVPFHLIDVPMRLVQDAKELVAAIREDLLGGVFPAIVVIDTVNRSMTGSESDDKDMPAYLAAADFIRATFGCAVILIHHCGHDASRPRGHTSLPGAVDAQIAVKRDAANHIVARTELMRDDADGEEFVSDLDPVQVGVNVYGETIMSCVVVPVGGASAASTKPTTKPQPKGAAKIALGALHEAVINHGRVPPASNNIPFGVSVVTVEQWRQTAFRKGISDSPDPKIRAQAFRRAYDALLAAQFIGVWEPDVWLV